MLPHYLSIGMSKNEFMHSTPKVLKAYDKAYETKLKTLDALAWQFCGNYVLSAVSVAVEHCLAGKKARSKYIDKPVMRELGELTNGENQESREEIAVFEMKQRIRLLQQQGLPESPM